jgi:hypothetical protein
VRAEIGEGVKVKLGEIIASNHWGTPEIQYRTGSGGNNFREAALRQPPLMQNEGSNMLHYLFGKTDLLVKLGLVFR